MSLRVALTSLLIALLPVIANAADFNALAAMDKAVQQFMDRADEANINGAYQGMRPYLGVNADAYDTSADKADKYFQQVFDKVGKPIGAEIVRRESIGNDFYKVTTLQKYDTAAFAWEFTFYQPKSGWKLVGISYGTEIGDLYQTAP